MTDYKPVRPAAFAGKFYPELPAVLRQNILTLLATAPADELPGLKAILVPHAGYIYSGPTAGRLFASLLGAQRRIRRVVLLGPSHRVRLSGLAVPAATHWATPLGLLPIDAELKARLQHLPQVTVDDAPHAQEHSLEVQLPFLQCLLPECTILPLAVGQVAPAAVAEVLDALWGDSETLILISSDLSHYLPYDAAVATDRATLNKLLECIPQLVGEQACGAAPANGFFVAARRRGLLSRLIDYRNSGDTAGDRERVVGYAALAYIDPLARLGETLLKLARGVIEAQFGGPGVTLPALPELQQMAATFVTLTQGGRLRGCIGSLAAQRKLLDDVAHNARAAAFADPRFKPLAASELASTRVEVSLLAPPEKMQFVDEADALRQLRPGIDGLILSDGEHRATYLPQVWEQLPEPARFLAQLKEKAGLPPTHWSAQLQLQRYTVHKWKAPI